MSSSKQLLLRFGNNLRLIFRDTIIFHIYIFRHHIGSFESLTSPVVKLFVIHIKKCLNICPILLTGRQIICVFVLPEPERAPIVHRQFQLAIGIVMSVTGIEECLLTSIRLRLLLLLE